MPLSAWPLNATGGLVTQDGSSHVVRHMASEGLVTYSSPSYPIPGRRLRPRQGTPVGAPGDSGHSATPSRLPDRRRRPPTERPVAARRGLSHGRVSPVASGTRRVVRLRRCVGRWVRTVRFGFRLSRAGRRDRPVTPRRNRVLIASRYGAYSIYNFTPLNTNSLI